MATRRRRQESVGRGKETVFASLGVARLVNVAAAAVAWMGFMFAVHACCTNNLAVTVTLTLTLTPTHTDTHPRGDPYLTPNVSFVAICCLACCAPSPPRHTHIGLWAFTAFAVY